MEDPFKVCHCTIYPENTPVASDLDSIDHVGKNQTQASRDNRKHMKAEVARRFMHGGSAVVEQARPWNDQMAKRVDELVPKVMAKIEAWRGEGASAPEEGSDLNPMYDDFAQAKPWITGTFRGRETEMYAPIAAFFRFVAHFVKREADKDTAEGSEKLAIRCRLVLPFKDTDAVPEAAVEDKRIDVGLVTVPASFPVESMSDLSYRTIFAIFEAKRQGDKSLGAAKEDAHAQLLDYTRNLPARQLHRRFCWGISCVDFTVWACLFSNHRVHESNAMDVTTLEGIQQLVRLILNWSFCGWSQLGYDKTLYWDFDLDCYVVKVPDGAPGMYKVYYTKDVVMSADRLFGRHCRCILATSTKPNGPVSETNPIIPDVVIKDSWVMYVDRNANVASDTTAAVVNAATHVDYALKEAEKAAKDARAAARDAEKAKKASKPAAEAKPGHVGILGYNSIVDSASSKVDDEDTGAMTRDAVRNAAGAAAAAADNAATTARAIANAAKTAVEEAGNVAAITNIVDAVVKAADTAVKAANSQHRHVPTSDAVEAITADIARAVSKLASSARFKHNIATIAAAGASETAKVVDGNGKVLIAAAAVARAAAAAAARFNKKVAAAIPDPEDADDSESDDAAVPESYDTAVPENAISAFRRTVAAAAVATAVTSVAAAVAAGTGAAAAAAAVMTAATHVAGSKSRIGTPDAIAAISRGTAKPCISSTVAATAMASAAAVSIVAAVSSDVDISGVAEQLEKLHISGQTRLGWPQPRFNPYAEESHALLHSEYSMLEQVNMELAGRADLKGCYPKLLCGGWVYQPLDPGDSRQNDNACGSNGPLIRNWFVLGSTHEMLGHLDPKDLYNVPFCAAMRIAMTPIGRELNTATSVKELICVLRDAMRCYMAVHEKCGILHRDISDGNIIITEVNGAIRGMLIDYGYALDVINNYPTRPERTGTFPFMSVANLENLPIDRTILDDWESLLYMICTIGTYGIGGDFQGFNGAKLPIRQWYEGTAKQVAKAKRTYMDSAAAFQTNIIGGFYGRRKSGVNKLKRLAMDLHECLFLNKRFKDKRVCQGALQKVPEDMGKGYDEARIDPFAARTEHALEIGKELLEIMESAAAKYST